MSKERIQKILAQNGYSSRRKVESLIKEGRVFINDIPAKLGDKISNEDKVYIDGKVINIQERISSELLMYNKPVGEECSHASSKRTIFENLPKPKSGKWSSQDDVRKRIEKQDRDKSRAIKTNPPAGP